MHTHPKGAAQRVHAAAATVRAVKWLTYAVGALWLTVFAGLVIAAVVAA
jgi:hypothetical protein